MKSDTFLPRIMILITDVEVDKKIHKLFSKLQMPIYYQCRGLGTAKSELLDICGLQGRTRLITVAMLTRAMADRVFNILSEKLDIDRKGGGIAFTIPATGMQEAMWRMLSEEAQEMIKKNAERDEQRMRQEATHAMVLVAVSQGHSDEVIDVAQKAGAKGGSIIRGRRRGSEAMVQFLGLSIQEEQEIVMIIAPRKIKSDIMKAIGSKCGLKTPARGIVFSVPIDEVVGMEE